MNYTVKEIGKVFVVQDLDFIVDKVTVIKDSKWQVEEIDYDNKKAVLRNREHYPVSTIRVEFDTYEKLQKSDILVYFDKVKEKTEPKFEIGEIVSIWDEYCLIKNRHYDKVAEVWDYRVLQLEEMLEDDTEIRYQYFSEEYLRKVEEEVLEIVLEGNEGRKYIIDFRVNQKGLRIPTKLEQAAEGMAAYISSLDIDEDICKKVDCKNKEEDNEECIDCILDYFTTQCWYEVDEVCVNDETEYTADFVNSRICGACKYKDVK